MSHRIAEFAKAAWIGGSLGFCGSSLVLTHRGNPTRSIPPMDQRDLIEKYTILGVTAGSTIVCLRHWAPQTMLILSGAFAPNYLRLREATDRIPN